MEGGGDDDPELADIKFHDAIKHLNTSVADGSLDVHRAERLKVAFEKLHNEYLKTCKNQKAYFRTVKDLRDQVTAQRKQIEHTGTSTFDDQSQKGTLTRDLLKAKMELELARGRSHQRMIEKEATENVLQEKKLELERKEEADKNRAQPDMQQRLVDELLRERARQQTQEQRYRTEKKGLEEKVQECAARKEELSHDVARLRNRELRSRDDHIKEQRQIAQKRNSIQEVEDKVIKAKRELAEKEQKLAEVQKLAASLEADLRAAVEEQEKGAGERDALRGAGESAAQKLAELKDARAYFVNRSTEAAESAKRMKKKIDQLSVELTRETKRHTDVQKKHTALLKEKELVESQLPGLTAELQTVKAKAKKDAAALAAAEKRRKQAEIANKLSIDTFLTQEKQKNTRTEELRESMQEISELERDLHELQKKERQLATVTNDLSLAREQSAGECTKLARKLKETQDAHRMVQLVARDLAKQVADVEKQTREKEMMYNAVKTERNKYVNMLQRSQQEAAEFKEKLKILTNETEILRAEIAAKEKEYVANNLAHKDACTQRDALRIEVNKFLFTYEKMRDVIDQQLAEIERLNATINQAEAAMLKLKGLYEQAVEDRNATGIQLIDRNDELCILYEKSNIQEKYLRQGEVEIKEREEEIRISKLAVATIARQKEFYTPKASLHLVEELKTQIMLLTFELENEQAIAEMLSRDLVDPKNEDRFRLLEGKDPKKEELYSKMANLEERLNGKEEQLLEKTLVLDELSNLSNRERANAQSTSNDTLELAKKVNDFQARIRDTTRKIMAALSELSIYKFNAMKLQQEKAEHETELQEGLQRLEAGLAPTALAAKEWSTFLEKVARDERRAEEGVDDDDDDDEVDGAPTTAAPRVNAYIPHHTTGELPIPKPFLFPRVEPRPAGSSMRHIRNPKVPDIVL